MYIIDTYKDFPQVEVNLCGINNLQTTKSVTQSTNWQTMNISHPRRNKVALSHTYISNIKYRLTLSDIPILWNQIASILELELSRPAAEELELEFSPFSLEAGMESSPQSPRNDKKKLENL